MARAKKASGSKAKAKQAPRSKAKAKKAEVKTVDDQGVEVVKQGLDMDDGIVIGAGLVTLGAAVLMYMAGGNYAG